MCFRLFLGQNVVSRVMIQWPANGTQDPR